MEEVELSRLPGNRQHTNSMLLPSTFSLFNAPKQSSSMGWHICFIVKHFLRDSPSVNVTSLVWTLLAIATKHFPGVKRTMLSLFLPCCRWKQLVCPFLVQECQWGQRARMVYNKVLYLSWLGGLCTHCCFLPAWWWLLACQFPFAVTGTAQKGKRKGRPQVAGYRHGVGERWEVAWSRLIRGLMTQSDRGAEKSSKQICWELFIASLRGHEVFSMWKA